MAKLSYKRRQKLPASEFAEPSKRKYPLDTRNRAKNALSRASQNASPAEDAAIKRKVHKKFPGIKVSGLHGSGKKRSKKRETRKISLSKR